MLLAGQGSVRSSANVVAVSNSDVNGLSGLSLAQPVVQSYNATVPALYQSNYTSLETTLASFNASLGAYPATRNNFAYSASLVPADGNQGTTLLQANNQNTVNANLDAYQSMGIKEVEISIPFPILYPTFPNSSQYLSYYTQLVQNVHSRGMKALVESHVAFVGTGYSNLNYSFKSLPYSQFVTEDTAQDQLIINQIKPDYIDIGTEADTEASLTRYSQLDTASGWTSYIEQILSSLDKSNSPTKVCAGAGTWLGVQFMQGFANDPRLDFLTAHIYPIYGNNLQTLVQMAQIAQQSGKRLVISESWSEEVTVPSPPPGTGVGGEFADHQELWGFSSNIDVPFLSIMARFSSIYPVEVYNAFSEQYFFAYLNYTPQLDAEDYFTLDGQINQVWAQNMRSLTLTPTGEEYYLLAHGASGSSSTSSTSSTSTTNPTSSSSSKSSTQTATTTTVTSSKTSSSSSTVPEFPNPLLALVVPLGAAALLGLRSRPRKQR